VEAKLHAFSTLALDGDEWLASFSGRFILGEKVLDTYLKEGWVDTRAGPDVVLKEKITVVCVCISSSNGA